MRRPRIEGFAVFEALLVLIVLAAIGFTGWYVWHSQKSPKNATTRTTKSINSTEKYKLVSHAELISCARSQNFGGAIFVGLGPDDNGQVPVDYSVLECSRKNPSAGQFSLIYSKAFPTVTARDEPTHSAKWTDLPTALQAAIAANGIDADSPLNTSPADYFAKYGKLRYSPSGFADYGDASYKVWALVDGSWKMILSSQDSGLSCGDIKKYDVPYGIVSHDPANKAICADENAIYHVVVKE